MTRMHVQTGICCCNMIHESLENNFTDLTVDSAKYAKNLILAFRHLQMCPSENRLQIHTPLAYSLAPHLRN